MLVTLYCDASFDSRTRTGGWGVWLRSDEGRIIKAGPCPPYLRFSYEAELSAIFAGLWLACNTWEKTEAVLVRSDAQDALRIIVGRQNAKHRAAKRLFFKIKDLCRDKNVKIIPRWVKGHQAGSNTDAWLNRRVDELAYGQMSLLRAQAKEPT